MLICWPRDRGTTKRFRSIVRTVYVLPSVDAIQRSRHHRRTCDSVSTRANERNDALFRPAIRQNALIRRLFNGGPLRPTSARLRRPPASVRGRPTDSPAFDARPWTTLTVRTTADAWPPAQQATVSTYGRYTGVASVD